MNLRCVGTLSVFTVSVLSGCASWMGTSLEGKFGARPNAVSLSSAGSSESSPLEKATAHYALGKSHVQAKKWREAMSEFDIALNWSPGHVDSINGKGLILAEHKLYQEALATLQFALKLNPDSAVTQSNMAYVLLKLNRLPEAATLMRSAYELDPKLAVVKSNWVELVRLSAKDSEFSSMLHRYPLGTPALALNNPEVSTQVVREISTVLKSSTGFSTAVINLPAFPPVPVVVPLQRSASPEGTAANSQALKAASSATVVNLNYDVMSSSAASVRQAETFSPPVANVRESTLVMIEPPKVSMMANVVARVEIVNGNGTSGAAARYGRTLLSHGLKVTKLTNAKSFSQQGNVVYYHRSQSQVARTIAGGLPGKVVLIQVGYMPGYDVRVVLGRTVKRPMI